MTKSRAWYAIESASFASERLRLVAVNTSMANKVRNQLHRRKAKKEIEATNFPNLPDIDVKLVDKLSDIIRKLVEERG